MYFYFILFFPIRHILKESTLAIPFQPLPTLTQPSSPESSQEVLTSNIRPRPRLPSLRMSLPFPKQAHSYNVFALPQPRLSLPLSSPLLPSLIDK